MREDDGGGAPGTLVSDEPGIAPLSFSPTGVILFDVEEIEVVLELASVSLAPGTYWIEIFAETLEPGAFWHWETGSPVDADQLPEGAFAFEVPGSTWLPLQSRTLSITLCDATIPVELTSFVVE